MDMQNDLRRQPMGQMSEDEIQEMLVLASRLREQTGGNLDDDAIIAVAEATGTSPDYVRLAVMSLPTENRKETIWDRLRASYIAFSPDHRRFFLAGVLGIAAGATAFFGDLFTRDVSGLWETLSFISFIFGMVNATVSRNVRVAAGSGALTGAVSMLTISLLGFVAALVVRGSAVGAGIPYFVIAVLAGAFLGSASFSIFNKNRAKLGFRDPVAERHALISQLMEIQSQLKSDEKFVTFMSVDVVGSTRMKTENDPISVEFTFNEYHAFVESVVVRNGGRIHSTAGDGVTAVFEEPRAAFQAGKALQAGLFEFNSFRNKLATEIELRAGLHTGNILAPGKDSTSVNFAHVIDIAAHMQKYAPSGTLVVSEHTAMYFGGLKAVSDELVDVDDLKAAVWRPRRRALPEGMPAQRSD